MNAIRFIHTADWQLGMTRHFLGEEAQARFSQARFDALRTIGRIAREQDCKFVVACGDVFEANAVDRRTIIRACEALSGISVPVYLLPGNHDPLDAGSVFRSPTFVANRPAQVRILDDSTPIQVAPGVELVGVPWFSKRPTRDMVSTTLAELPPFADGVRIVAAHGAIRGLFAPDRDLLHEIAPDAVDAALADSRLHYLALGDRHSTTCVGDTRRIWYAGAPEPTDYDETDAGHALVVDLSRESVAVEKADTGTWRYLTNARDLAASDEDLDLLERWLAEAADKERVILRLAIRGTLTVKRKSRLDAMLDDARLRFGALGLVMSPSDLRVIPEDADFADLALEGFANSAVQKLREQAQEGGERAVVARDALGLLLRLAGQST